MNAIFAFTALSFCLRRLSSPFEARYISYFSQMCLEGIIINVWFSLQCHSQDVCSDIGCELYVKDCCDVIVSASEWNGLKMGHILYILSVLHTSSWKWDSYTIQFANAILWIMNSDTGWFTVVAHILYCLILPRKVATQQQWEAQFLCLVPLLD